MNLSSRIRGRSINASALLLGLALLTARPASADLKLLSLPANDLVYDAGRNRLYASVPEKAGARGNSVAVIDPETGAIGPIIPVGPDPGKLALSDDGRYLYVGLDGAGAVRRIDLPAQKSDLQFSLGGDMYGPYTVGDMQVIPGSPRSVAIARRRAKVSPGAVGVAVYDNGVRRPKVTDRSDRIQFSASPAVLYGLFEGEFFERMSVDPSGVTLLDDVSLSRNNGVYDFTYAGGRLYLSSGDIVDPEQRQVIGTFPNVPYPSLVLPDPDVDRVYFLAYSRSYFGPLPQLLAYDQQSLRLVASQAIPARFENASGFVKWGTDGLAFRTDADQVALLRTRLRVPGVLSADLAVTGGLSPNPVRVGGALTYQMWVQNYGPDAESRAMLSSVLPSGSAFVSLSASQGRCLRFGRRITCELGPLPAGARAVVTLVVRPLVAGPLFHTATLRGQVPDPQTANNTATQRTSVVFPVPDPLGSGERLPVLDVEARQISLAAQDLVYDPLTRQIYASLPSRAGMFGNSVVALDPLSGAVRAPIPVGSEPGKLALSDDGRYLYVALDGAAAVRRVDLRTQTADLQFPLGTDPMGGPLFAADLQAVPGEPQAVAVVRRTGTAPYGVRGVTIYDNGLPRPKTTVGDSAVSTEIQFSSSSWRLYGFNSDSLYLNFQRMAVDDLGVSVLDASSALVGGFPPVMRFDQGFIFTSGGRVIDPEARLPVGTIPNLSGHALVAPDHAAGQVFYLTGDSSTRELRVYDTLTLLPLARIGVPNVAGRAGSLIRWGQEPGDGLGGLAFLTDDNQIFLLRLVLRDPTGLRLAVFPAAVGGGSAAAGVVTLSHPAPAGGAVVLLASGSPGSVSVPPSVLVPARATRATFPVATRPAPAAVDVALTASYAGVERTTALRLLPAPPPAATGGIAGRAHSTAARDGAPTGTAAHPRRRG